MDRSRNGVLTHAVRTGVLRGDKVSSKSARNECCIKKCRTVKICNKFEIIGSEMSINEHCVIVFKPFTYVF